LAKADEEGDGREVKEFVERGAEVYTKA